MRQLLLLRHAKSSWDDPRLSDHARPLNARGRRGAVAMGEAMRGLGLRPDIVLVSSARRTLQTLEAIGPLVAALGGTPAVEPMDDLYLAPWPRLLDVLRRGRDGVRCALLIGHNPGLHELAMALMEAGAMAAEASRLAEGCPTGTLCEFAVAGPWRDLGAGGGRLVRILTPADLPSGDPGDTTELPA